MFHLSLRVVDSEVRSECRSKQMISRCAIHFLVITLVWPVQSYVQYRYFAFEYVKGVAKVKLTHSYIVDCNSTRHMFT